MLVSTVAFHSNAVRDVVMNTKYLTGLMSALSRVNGIIIVVKIQAAFFAAFPSRIIHNTKISNAFTCFFYFPHSRLFKIKMQQSNTRLLFSALHPGVVWTWIRSVRQDTNRKGRRALYSFSSNPINESIVR